MLHTPAMVAELVGVPAAVVRSWQRRGWIVPQAIEHKLPQFDFAELSVARTLAELHRAGIKPRAIERKLAEISTKFPQVRRPLAELTLVVDGRTLLVRRDDELLEPAGQLRIDFDSLAEDAVAEQPRTIISPALFLSRNTSPEAAAPKQLEEWAAELEEAGELSAAAEMYRAALAAGGPRAELCFALAETLYRLGDLPAARERYFMAIELDEDFAEARANLGCLLAEQGELSLAASALEGAIACHGQYADAHYHLARVLDELGRAEEAAEHWRAFLDLAPDSPWQEEARRRVES